MNIPIASAQVKTFLRRDCLLLLRKYAHSSVCSNQEQNVGSRLQLLVTKLQLGNNNVIAEQIMVDEQWIGIQGSCYASTGMSG
jgi:hypothetical protein